MQKHAYIYAKTCLHLCKNMLTFMQKHVYIYAKTCLHLCKNMFTFMQKHVYIYAKTCLHLCKNMFTFMQKHVYIYAKTCLHLCKNMFTFMQMKNTLQTIIIRLRLVCCIKLKSILQESIVHTFSVNKSLDFILYTYYRLNIILKQWNYSSNLFLTCCSELLLNMRAGANSRACKHIYTAATHTHTYKHTHTHTHNKKIKSLVNMKIFYTWQKQ